MDFAENPSRERTLERIRKALQSEQFSGASLGEAQNGTVGAPYREARGGNVGPIFPTIDDPFQRFAAECKSNLTELVLTDSREASSGAIQKVLSLLPAGEVFVQDSPELREILSKPRMESGEAANEASAGESEIGSIAVHTGIVGGSASGGERTLRWSSERPARESSQACITMAEALIAQTGSVMVSSAMGGRRASIVPPCHVVFATRDQIVPDIEAALAQAERRGLTGNSYLGLITGSSRTADIEKILVLGAHGPMRVVVVLEGQ